MCIRILYMYFVLCTEDKVSLVERGCEWGVFRKLQFSGQNVTSDHGLHQKP